MRLALAMAFACANAACTYTEARVESADGAKVTRRAGTVPGSERRYALVVPRMDLLEIRVRAEVLCETHTEQRIERQEVVETRASTGRFVGAAAALAVGAVFVSEGERAMGIGFLGLGGGLALVPLTYEGETRRRLPAETRIGAPYGSVPCGDRPLANVRVTVRLPERTLEGQSDVAGRVRFRDATAGPGTLVYVEDVAVPVSVGTPPSGGLAPAPEESQPAE